MSNRDTRLFPIGSKDNPANFSVPGFIAPSQNSTGVYVSLINAIIPNSWYVLNTTNKVLAGQLIAPDTTVTNLTITINESDYGSYDATEFTDLLNAYIGRYVIMQPPLFTFVFNEKKGKIGVTWATPNLGYSYQVTAGSTMYNLVGKETNEGIYVFHDNDPYIYFENVINLSGITNYVINCPQIPTQNYDTIFQGGFFMNIPVFGENYEQVVWENTIGTAFFVPINHEIDQISVTLYDDFQNVIDFNGVGWKLTFAVSYIWGTDREYTNIKDKLTMPRSILQDEGGEV